MNADWPSTVQMRNPAENQAFKIDGRLTVLIYVLLTISALIPLGFTDVPFLVDFPNHLARIHIIANLDQDAALASNYQVAWGVLPNLAFEIVSTPFAGTIPIEILGRMFIALIFILLIAGTLALRRVVHGHVDMWAAGTFLFLYNHLLIMGFVNYLFSLGIALLLFAGWIASRSLQPTIRILLFSAAAAALFFCHLFALAVYAICVGGHEIGLRYRELRGDWFGVAKQWLFGAMQFVPVAIIILATMPDIQGREMIYGTFVQKLRAAWSPTLTYQTPLDLVLLLFVTGVLTVGLARRKFVIAPQLRGPLLVMIPLAIAMPFWIRGAWGSVAYSDLRLPLAVALLLMAGLKIRDVKRETLFALACAAAVMFGARIVDMATQWRQADHEFAEFRAATAVIPKGAAVLPVQILNAHFTTGIPRFEYAYWHLAALTVIDRSTFMPFLFTDPAKQPVRAAPTRLAIDAPFGAPIDYQQMYEGMADMLAKTDNRSGAQPYWENWPAHYDYLLLTHFGVKETPVPSVLTPVHEGSFFTIFKIAAPPGK